MGFELRDFRLLLEIHEGGSITAAAERLGYSQSAASQQLHRAEQTVGTALVVREGRRTVLTEAGRALVEHAQELLSGARRAVSNARLLADAGPGSLRVATFSSVANTLLPPALGAMRRTAPGVSLTLREGETERCLSLLQRGEADIAVVYTWPEPPRRSAGPEDFPGLDRERFVTFPICREPVYIAAPSSGFQDGPALPIELATLRTARWIAGCPICRQGLVDACERAGFSPQIDFETDDYHAMLALVESGMGCALVTGLMVRSAGASLGCRLWRCQPAQFRVVTAVVPRPIARTAQIRALLSELREASGELTAEAPSAAQSGSTR